MKYELRRIMDGKETNLIIRRYLEKYTAPSLMAQILIQQQEA